MKKYFLFILLTIILVSSIACSAQTSTPSTAPQQVSPPTTPPASEPPKTAPTTAPETPKPTPPPTPKEAELSYDDGIATDFLAAGGGYLIDFSPPATPFTVKKVKAKAGLAGSGYEGKDFKVEIWDSNQKVLHSATYPVTKFVKIPPPPQWVEFEVPDIIVNGKFYVHIFTGTDRLKGIHMGADDSVVNQHSEHTILTVTDTVKIRPDWPYPSNQWMGDKSKVNWLIRVIGTY